MWNLYIHGFSTCISQVTSSDLQNCNKFASMDISRALRMKEGLGEASYAKNSFVQKRGMEASKHVVIECAVDFYNSEKPQTLMLADLGCSSGENSLSLTGSIIKAVEGSCCEASLQPPDFMLFLNDLPTNDFNTLFEKIIPDFVSKLEIGGGDGGGDRPSVFMAAIPGSFYGRLFPDNSLHFINSWFGLHWLSQVPSGLFDEEGKPINKGKVYISPTSPSPVIKSYFNQFQKDFSLFLKSRAPEIIHGGRLVLAMLGRKIDDHCERNSTFPWEILCQSLAVMVSKGLIKEEKVDSYNVPFYAPSPKEVEDEVRKEGSFVIDHIQTCDFFANSGDAEKDGMIGTVTMRAIQEPMICHHFGGGIIEELFQHLRAILSDTMAKEEIAVPYLVVVLRKLQ